jgi:starch phosphorylase
MLAAEPLAHVRNGAIYRVTFGTKRPPEHFTVRVVPYHADAVIPIENPLIAWQR